jgi:tape measure domain-containing protein
MSSIDQRIVQMRFDNKDFESNVGTTMSTLEKLKEKLKFTKSDEGIQNLKNSFNGFDFSAMQTGIDTLNDRFSVLGIAGMEVIRRLTNAAIDMGQKLASAFTTDAIRDGFAEYELKMGSIQTILMGAHTKEGLPVTLDMVNQKLNELNTYADKTIYSFSDMTSNIGKFTNAGVSLEDSVDAIQGIANVAALSGANAQQASHAMYNFAQALSSGSVKLIDWKSIENAQMATQEFKQALIQTAEEVGTLVKEGDQWISTTVDANGHTSDLFDSTLGFNDSLKAQWMTTEVLTKTLARYSDETDELGKKAFEAATQVKTFSQLVDTVKEALGSGWAMTFEYIVGNFEEAKQLWTGVNNEISKVLDPIADARNEMFKFWHDNGGRDAMIEAIRAVWEGFKGIAGTIKSIGGDIFESAFGKLDGARLVKITESIRDFFKSLVPSQELKSGFEAVLTTFFEVIRNGVEQIQRAGRFISMFWEAIEPGRKILYGIIQDGAEAVELVSSILARIGDAFENNGGLKALANGFANLFNGIMQVLEPVSTAVLDFFQKVYDSPFIQRLGEKLAEVAKGFEYLTQSIDFTSVANSLSTALSKVWSVLSKIGSVVKPFIDTIADFASDVLGINKNVDESVSTLDRFKSIVDNVKTALTNLKETAVQWFLDHAPAEMIDDVSSAVDKLNGFLQPLRERINDIKESFQDGSWYSKLKDWLEGVVEKVNELRKTIGDFIADNAVKAFTAVWETIAGAFNKFVDAVKAGWNFIKKVWKSLFGEDLYTAVNRIFEFAAKFGGIKALFSFTDILSGISDLTEGLGKLKDNLEKAAFNLEKSLVAPLKGFATEKKSLALRNVAVAIEILAGSLIALSFVEFDKIQNGVIAVGELLGMLVGFYAAIEILGKKLNGTQGNNGGLLGALIGSNGASALKSNSIGFVLLAGSVLMLSFSLANLADIPFWDIQKGILAIIEIMTALALFSKYTKDIKMGAIDISAVGIAVDLLSKAVTNIGKLDFESWLLGIGGLALVMTELTAFLHDMENVKASGFTNVIALAAGIRVLVMSVRAMAGLDLAGLLKGLGGVAVLMVELYFFTKKMSDIDAESFNSLIVLAVALRVLVMSVKSLGNMDFESFLQGLGGVAILLIELTAFMHDMNTAATLGIKAAAGLVILAVAIKALSGVVVKLGSMSLGDMIQGIAGLAGVMIILVGACKLLKTASPMMLVAGAAMIVMAGAVWLLIPPMIALSAIPFGKLATALIGIAGAFTIFGVAGYIIGKIGKEMVIAAAGIGIMAAAIWLIVPPLIALSALPFPKLMTALLGLAGTFTIFGIAGKILAPMAADMILAAGGILAMSAAAAGAGAAMIVLAAGLKAMSSAIMTVMDTILALLQSILSGLPFIGDDIDNWFTERRAALKKTMDPADSKKTGEDWAAGLKEGVTGAADPIKDAAGEVQTAMSNASSGAEESGYGTGMGFLEGLELSDVKGIVTGDTDAMGETVQKMLSEHGVNAGDMFGQGILDGYDSSDPTGSIQDMLGDDMGGIQDMLGEYGFNAGETLTSSMSEGVSHGAPGLYLTVGNETRLVTDAILTHYKDMGFITGQEYTQAIADKAESGTGEVKLTMETALTRLEGIDITHPGATVGDTFLEGLRSKTSEARDVITNDLGGEVESALEDTKQYFTDGGENSADAFAMSLMDQTMGVADAAEEVGAAATEELDDSKYDAEDAGENVGYGFGDGMSNTSGYAESAARDIAARALRAMAEELDINSPSKETMKLGRFGGIGLGNGFTNSIGYVKKKASSLADTGLYAMQSVMERLRDSLNFTPDMDPTISPVMDLSQIQNGMNMIGNMFGSQQFAVAGAFGMDPYAFRSIRAVTAAADMAPRRNDDVVSAVNSLGKDISTLKTAMEQMKFEVNGKAIGEVAYKEVDRRLGNTVTRNRREGRG